MVGIKRDVTGALGDTVVCYSWCFFLLLKAQQQFSHTISETPDMHEECRSIIVAFKHNK